MKKLIMLAGLLVLILSSCSMPEAENVVMEITDAAGNRFLRAQNQAVDFYFYYPENFILDINAAMISIFISNPEWVDNDLETGRTLAFPVNPNISVTVFSRRGDIETAQQWWDEFVMPALGEIYQDMEIESSEDIIVAGYRGRKFVYSYTLGGREFRQAKVIFFRNNNVYHMIYTATASRFNTHLEVLGVVIETFAFR